MGVYLHNVLKRKDISSVASTRKFLELFMNTLLTHPRMQHPPRFFSLDVYSSQKDVIMDTLRSTLAELAGSVVPGVSERSASLAAGGESSVMGDRASQVVKQSVLQRTKPPSSSSRLPRIKAEAQQQTRRSRSHVSSRRPPPHPAKSVQSVKSIRLAGGDKTNKNHSHAPEPAPTKSHRPATKSVMSSVRPDESVSCAPAKPYRRSKSTL